MAEAPMKDPSEFLGAVMRRASEDSDFRAAVLADAKSAISEEFGHSPRDGLNLVVHENTADTFHIPLPPGPSMIDEGDLAAVSGGGWQSICVW